MTTTVMDTDDSPTKAPLYEGDAERNPSAATSQPALGSPSPDDVPILPADEPTITSSEDVTASIPTTDGYHSTEPALPPRPSEPPLGAAEHVEDTNISSELAPLHAMFPDFDPVVLQSVLESVGGNQDEAIETLLGMSDPDYVPQHTQHEPSQSELDEQLARRLMLEDQEQQRVWQERQQQQQVPYQPRSRNYQFREGQQEGQAGQEGNRDTMSEVQEQFKQIAESGKRTFASIVTKVKAKVQEYDNSRQSQGSSQQSGQGSGRLPARHEQQAYYAPTVDPSSYQAEPTRAPVSTQGYDVTPQHESTPRAPSRQPSGTGQGIFLDDHRTPSPSNSAPAPPSTQSGPPPGNFDASKIGLLPRRPVSLIGPSQTQHSGDDDDEVDYAENPFENSR